MGRPLVSWWRPDKGPTRVWKTLFPCNWNPLLNQSCSPFMCGQTLVFLALCLFSGETCVPGRGGVSAGGISSWLSGRVAVILWDVGVERPAPGRSVFWG